VTGPDVTERDSAGRAGAVPAGPLAGEPRERALDLPWARRAGSWLIWWVLMMAFWVMLDDSIATDELLAGAGAAALAALLAEQVTYQAASRFRMRISWLVPALRLPGEVAGDMVIVYAALWRRLAGGQQPDSAFAELPARFGDDTGAGVTRRTLLIGGRSLAPNTFVLGIDPERDVMVVHQLVAGRRPDGPDGSDGSG
jgi:multisubunit Na+/H+ antiporter MnhE subunit